MHALEERGAESSPIERAQADRGRRLTFEAIVRLLRKVLLQLMVLAGTHWGDKDSRPSKYQVLFVVSALVCVAKAGLHEDRVTFTVEKRGERWYIFQEN